MSQSHPKDKKDIAQEDPQEEKDLLIIDLNSPYCIFKLTQIAALMEVEDGRIQLRQLESEESKKLCDGAREGNGVITIDIICKDLEKDQWIKEKFHIPGFGDGDRLAREDKEGKEYIFESA